MWTSEGGANVAKNFAFNIAILRQLSASILILAVRSLPTPFTPFPAPPRRPWILSPDLAVQSGRFRNDIL